MVGKKGLDLRKLLLGAVVIGGIAAVGLGLAGIDQSQSTLHTAVEANTQQMADIGTRIERQVTDKMTLIEESQQDLHAGMEGVGKENSVKARIVKFDTSDDMNITYTGEAALPAKFYQEQYSFEDYCEETCNITGAFVGDYKLVVEVIGDIYLTLDKMSYSVIPLIEVEEIVKDFPEIVLEEKYGWNGDYKLKDNYDSTFDLEVFTQPRAKQEMMSVPPEMEARLMSSFTCSYTKRKLSSDRGEPVEHIDLRLERSYCSAGFSPAFSTAAMYRALVPNIVIFSS